MRRAFIVVAVIGCAVSRPNVVAGDPAVTESFDLQPYTVTGASTADLRTAIRAARPATPDGVRFDPIARWMTARPAIAPTTKRRIMASCRGPSFPADLYALTRQIVCVKYTGMGATVRIDLEAADPVWRQIADQIRAALVAGRIKAGA